MHTVCDGHLPIDKVQVYLGHAATGERLKIGPDTYCEGSIVDEDAVNPSWELVTSASTELTGVGRGRARGVVKIPIRHRYGDPFVDHVYAAIGKTRQTGADLLLGRYDARRLRMDIQVHFDRIVSRTLQYAIQTSPPGEIDERMARPAYEVLLTNSGMGLVVCALMDLGFNIHLTSIEKRSKCREVLSQLFPGVQHYHSHDSTRVSLDLRERKFDLMIETGPCVMFSRLRGEDAKGFDDPRSDATVSACDLKSDLLRVNPHMSFMAENTVFASHLAEDFDRLQDMYQTRKGGIFKLNAAQTGDGASRPRVYAADFASRDLIPTVEPIQSARPALCGS